MAQSRPRMSESEYDTYKERKMFDKKVYRMVVFSDCHGWLADLKALRCINKVLQKNKFDEVIGNGDIIDAPYLSAHNKRLYSDGILKGYTETEEIRYTVEQILQPLRASTNARITVRIGNHCERITKPYLLGKSQLANLAILYKNLGTTEYSEMLQLDKMGMIYDPTPCANYFNIFDVVHGLSLAKNTSEKNIVDYMGSGTTGHTHRLSPHYLTNKKGNFVWFQSGCTRLIEEVEYLPTGVVANWQSGFIVVTFYEESPGKHIFFGEPVPIINGKCQYQGVIYDGNSN